MAADILPVLISLSNCLTSSFTSDFFCFGCLIWRAFASVKNSSIRPCFHKIMRRLSVLEFDPFVSDLVLGSSRCGRIIAAFIATLEFGVSSIPIESRNIRKIGTVSSNRFTKCTKFLLSAHSLQNIIHCRI